MVAMSTKKTNQKAKSSSHDEMTEAVSVVEDVLGSLLHVNDVAEELGITPRRVQQFCKQKRLGRMLMGRCWITRHELDEFKKIERLTGVRKELHIKRA